jgi:hypothetical protein
MVPYKKNPAKYVAAPATARVLLKQSWNERY